MNTYPDQLRVRKDNKNRKYSCPELKSFGSVSQLTTSGSGFDFESFAMGMCDESMTKRVNPSC
jgi:hypothetical protein